jgi:hypothetical protein
MSITGSIPARSLSVAMTFAAGFAALSATPAAAQDAARRPVIGITVGATQFDLAGTGTEAFGAVRVQVPLTRVFILEPGVGTFSYRPYDLPAAPRHRLWFPELQVQAQVRLGSVRPYLGAGGGAALIRVDGRTEIEETLSAAAGLRVDLPAGFSAGGELRVRAVNPWTGTTADWGLSLGRRL